MNRQKFASYADWRLPTIPELMSLLEPKKQSNGLYISPMFEMPEEYSWYWSADLRTKGEGWLVRFNYGYGDVSWGNRLHYYVRAVRS